MYTNIINSSNTGNNIKPKCYRNYPCTQPHPQNNDQIMLQLAPKKKQSTCRFANTDRIHSSLSSVKTINSLSRSNSSRYINHPKIKIPKNDKLTAFFNLDGLKRNNLNVDLTIQGKNKQRLVSSLQPNYYSKQNQNNNNYQDQIQKQFYTCHQNQMSQSRTRINKAVSLKSFQSCSLEKKIKQSFIRRQVSNNKFEQNQNQIRGKVNTVKNSIENYQQVQKDPSRTRSRLTIFDDYGLNQQNQKVQKIKNGKNCNKQKKRHDKIVLAPKTPRCIRSNSGNKKVVFPVHMKKLQNLHPIDKQIQDNAKSLKYGQNTQLQYTFGLSGTGFTKNVKV